MKERIFIIIILIAAISILVLSDFGNSARVTVYDCGMAEWHPDIPKSVREECRKIRKQIQEENSKESKKSYI